MDNVERKHCTKCGMKLPLHHFRMKRDETLTKQCMHCLDRNIGYRKKKIA